MSIEKIIEEREISEILHFTTNKGLLGVLDSEGLLPRKRLAANDRLEFILKYNAEYRKDTDWLDYVNLSISKINGQYFNSSGKWHVGADVWWCILSFKPEILIHDDVSFATTNNIYTGVKRGTGCEGLERLFGLKTVRWVNNVIARSPTLDKKFSTCEQAEVLYPGVVSTKYLQCIYVRDEESYDQVHAQIIATSHQKVEVKINPEMFRG